MVLISPQLSIGLSACSPLKACGAGKPEIGDHSNGAALRQMPAKAESADVENCGGRGAPLERRIVPAHGGAIRHAGSGSVSNRPTTQLTFTEANDSTFQLARAYAARE